jgi:type II secretory pathway component PulF
MVEPVAHKQKRIPRQFFVSREKEYLIDNLSMLVSSGMSIPDVLSSIRSELRSRGMKLLVGELKQQVESGTPLWRALDSTRLFPEHTIALIRIGEEAGKLASNLRAVALQEQKERKFRSRIRAALLYPVFVMFLTVLIGLGVAWFVLPRLSQVFEQINVELPLITILLIRVGDFLGDYGLYVVPASVILLTTLFYFIFVFKRTRWIGQGALLRLPGIRTLVLNVELSRFGFLLGTLLKAGLPIVDAIESLQKATISPGYRAFYGHLAKSVGEGGTFKGSFETFKGSRRLIPTPMQQLIIAGERSGRLDSSLIAVGEIYEVKTEAASQNVAVILEPLLLVVVWFGVLVVALAVILPIYGLLGGLNEATNSTPPSITP